MSETYNQEFIDAMREGILSLLHEWGFSAKSDVRLLNISENATYLAENKESGERIVVRVNRPGYHTLKEIESELLWVESLRNAETVRTACPLDLSSGGKIAQIKYEANDYPVVAFEFLPGKEPDPDNELKEDFYTLGVVTAKLHQHTKQWAIPVGFRRKVWDFDAMLGNQQLWGDWREAMGLKTEDIPLLEETALNLEKKLNEYGKGKECFGLVHADLRLANLLVDDGDLSVIDFDDCGYSWFMYDFAAAISFIEEDEQVPALQESWISGYRSVGEIATEDEAMFPHFIMLRRMLLTAWLASHSETETAQELGADFTDGTVRLAKLYLEKFNTVIV